MAVTCDRELGGLCVFHLRAVRCSCDCFWFSFDCFALFVCVVVSVTLCACVLCGRGRRAGKGLA